MLVERERVDYWVTLRVILGIFENFESIFKIITSQVFF